MDHFDIVRIVGLAICLVGAFMLRAELNPKPNAKATSSPAEEQKLS